MTQKLVSKKELKSVFECLLLRAYRLTSGRQFPNGYGSELAG